MSTPLAAFSASSSSSAAKNQHRDSSPYDWDATIKASSRRYPLMPIQDLHNDQHQTCDSTNTASSTTALPGSSVDTSKYREQGSATSMCRIASSRVDFESRTPTPSDETYEIVDGTLADDELSDAVTDTDAESRSRGASTNPSLAPYPSPAGRDSTSALSGSSISITSHCHRTTIKKSHRNIQPLAPTTPTTDEGRSLARRLIIQYARVIPYDSINPLVDNHPSIDPAASGLDRSYKVMHGLYGSVQEIHHGKYNHIFVVRTLSIPEEPDGLGPRQPYYAMKIYDKVGVAASSRSRMEGQRRMRNELRVYKRLAAVDLNLNGWNGFLFLMGLEAAFEDASRYFLLHAKELMRTDLRSLLDGHGATRLRVHRPTILAQIAVGLATLHSCGVVHRDLRPEKILIDHSGNAVVSGFAEAHVHSMVEPLLPGRAFCGGPAGVWPYAAPEVAKGGFGIEGDYWGLGCVAYEVERWSSQPLFESQKVLDYWCTQSEWDVDEIAEGLSFEDLSPRARLLIAGLAHPNPRRRFGFLDVLLDPYFERQRGGSVFDNLIVDGESGSWLPRADVGEVCKETYRPWSSTTPFVWINPGGSFVPNAGNGESDGSETDTVFEE